MPVKTTGLLELLAQWQPLAEGIGETEQLPLQDVHEFSRVPGLRVEDWLAPLV